MSSKKNSCRGNYMRKYGMSYHLWLRHSWYDKFTCAPAKALQKLSPSRKTTFHTTWASLFEMELELNLLDWNVNELLRTQTRTRGHETHLYGICQNGVGDHFPSPCPRFLRPWAWVMISFPRILSSLCIIQFSILVFKFVCISSRRTHFLANVFDN